MGQGQCALVSVSVPGSAPGAEWLVYVGGQSVGSVFGSAPCGPLFVQGGDVISIQSSPNTIFLQDPGGAVAVGVVGAQGELSPSGGITGGGLPVGVNVVAASYILTGPVSATTPVLNISQNARGVIVASTTTPQPTPGGPNFIPIDLVAMTIQYGGSGGGLAGLWWYAVTGGSQFTITFASAPTAWFVEEVDYDFDFYEVARGLGVYVVTVANPVTGADWGYSLPAPGRLVAAIATFDTSAAAGTRLPTLYMTNSPPTVINGRWPANTGQGPSSGNRCTWSKGGASPTALLGTAGNTFSLAGLPDILLPAGSSIGSLTAGMDVADGWNSIFLTLAPI